MKKKLIAGNWKMNGGLAANQALLQALLQDVGVPACDVAVAVPAACAFSSAVRRRRLFWNRVSRPSSKDRNCLGYMARDRGHSRVPEPPAMSTGTTGMLDATEGDGIRDSEIQGKSVDGKTARDSCLRLFSLE